MLALDQLLLRSHPAGPRAPLLSQAREDSRQSNGRHARNGHMPAEALSRIGARVGPGDRMLDLRTSDRLVPVPAPAD